MSYSFRLATEDDDGELRALCRRSTMRDDGPFSLGYGREPSFFHGLGVEGTFTQAGLYVDAESGEGVGCFTRAVRTAYVNGEPRPVGYLANARLVPEHRNGTLVARGYRELRRLHGDGRCPFYVSTILEGNAAARAMLTSGRAGLPTYHDVGRYVCHAVILGRKDGGAAVPGIEVVEGQRDMLGDIVACLDRNGRRRQFTPCWSVDDFTTENPLTRGLAVHDILVARRGTNVVGTLAMWDQRAYKQVSVERYGLAMRGVGLLWNFVMPRLGYGRLPGPGDEFATVFAALPAVDDDDPAVFRCLLAALTDRLAEGDLLCCVVGFAEGDPLSAVAAERLHFSYTSRIYVVCWDDGEAEFAALDSRRPYVEAATL